MDFRTMMYLEVKMSDDACSMMNHGWWRRGALGCLLASALCVFGACGSDEPEPQTPSNDVIDDASHDVDDSDTDSSDDDTPDAAPDTEDVPDADDDTPIEPGSRLEIQGLDGPITARFDEHGILFASCSTDADCAAALGYFHARDRFWQMDIRRRVTTGRLVQLVGEVALPIDSVNRPLFTVNNGMPAEDHMVEMADPETLELLEAYARGVNAWLDDMRAGRHGAELQFEYSNLLVNPDYIPDWTPADSFATILALIDQLTNDADTQIFLGEEFANATDPDLAFDFLAPLTPIQTAIDPDYADRVDRDAKSGRAHGISEARLRALQEAAPALASARERLAAGGRLGDRELVRGSNNWAVSPDGAAGPNALFSNDPHLTLSNAAIWYLASLDARTSGSGETRAAGATFPGLPWVVLGFNEDIAWGATTAYYDLVDVYLEELSADGQAVIFNGEEVPFVERTFTYGVPGGETWEASALYVPHHGPVLSIDRDAGTAVSMRWTGNQITTDGNFLTHVNRARSVEEARDALRQVTSLSQCWLVADIEGNIGLFPYSTVPRRPWASADRPSWIPMPGTGEYEWDGYLDYDDLPQLYNPERGYIVSANNDMTGALYAGDPAGYGHPPLQGGTAPGYRFARIVEMIEERFGDHTVDTMNEMLADTLMLVARRNLPELLDSIDPDALAEASDDAQEAIAYLRAWEFTCPTGFDGVEIGAPVRPGDRAEAIGCTLFHAFYYRLVVYALDDEGLGAGLSFGATTTTLALLLEGNEALRYEGDYWDDVDTDEVETMGDIVLISLESAVARLRSRGLEPGDDWLWGNFHTLTLRADLFSSLGIPSYDHGPFYNDGGLWTVDVAAPRSGFRGDFTHGHGASMRLACELMPEGPACTIQFPGGQSHDRDSPNYNDLLLLYLADEPIPFPFHSEAIDAATVNTLVVHPTP